MGKLLRLPLQQARQREGTDHQQDQADCGDMGMVGGKPQPGHPPPQLPPPPPPSNHLVQPPTSQPSTHPPPPNVKTDHFLPPTIHPVHFATFPPNAVCLSILHDTPLTFYFPYFHLIMKSWCFLNVIHSSCLNFWRIALARNCPFHSEWHFLSTELTLKAQVPNLESRPYVGWGVIQTHHRSSRLKTHVLQNLRLYDLIVMIAITALLVAWPKQ